MLGDYRHASPNGLCLVPRGLASVRADAVETLRVVCGLRVGELELAGGKLSSCPLRMIATECKQESH